MKEDRKFGCMKKFWDISFFGGIACTVLFTISIIIKLITPDPNFQIAILYIGLFFYGIIPAGLGYYFRLRFARAKENYRKALIQKMLFNLALSNNGIVKVTDVAMQLEITYEEAKEMLAKTAIEGISSPEIDEAGFVYYVFPELQKKINQINSSTSEMS